jgi:hypothetical protein
MKRLYEFEEYQKRLVLMTSLSYQNWRQQFINTTDCDAFEAFKSCWNEEIKDKKLVERFETLSSGTLATRRGLLT